MVTIEPELVKIFKFNQGTLLAPSGEAIAAFFWAVVTPSMLMSKRGVVGLSKEWIPEPQVPVRLALAPMAAGIEVALVTLPQS